ncbi:glycosyltransferase family 4 protein [Cognatishimia sp. 1_MG-2023]|uniref:glycosyltransferase family 4 protein n=1 Tax=Cognatishimia sp. 1_MG-2023 TaxID=3062642 RepID=UPI0026E2D861|nr:glycosyltransferase family 4 protein [Cognatishimia sp. 1_MG-2023]MDO6725749.1 glycosyltransferase family 4 protein [Cognatishimia sp. 1_MG-2023]
MGDLNRIAYLTGEYPRATDTFIQREVAALRDLGHHVETCSIRQTGVEHLVGEEQRTEAARTFYVLKAAKAPLHLLKCHWNFLRENPSRYFKSLKLALQTNPGGPKSTFYQLFYFAEAAVLGDYLRRQNITHLHNHIAKSSCSVAMLMSEMTGIPYSFTLHGPDIFFAPDHWRLDKKIEKASFVACISHFCRSQAMSFSNPAHWNKLHIVHCAIDPDRYDDASNKGGKRLLFVGRLAAVKGLPILLNAMADQPDLSLTVIGDGPDRAALEQQSADLGLASRVTFAGYKSQSEVATALTEHDIFVLPSFAEGVPVVLMEAMAAARPVITTQIAGIPELVTHEASGILIPPGDETALKTALKSLADNPEKQVQMGQTGRAKVVAEFNLNHEPAWLSQLLTGYANDTPPQSIRPPEASK